MKTIKPKNILLFALSTLMLSGCLPHSLTQWQAPTTPSSGSGSSTTGGVVAGTPVTDTTGATVTFDAPTKFSYQDTTGSNSLTFKVGDSVSLSPTLDGSLADPTKSSLFIVSCVVDSGALPSGITLSSSNCALTATRVSGKKYVTSESCSDGLSLDQGSCEANTYTWNATTSTCSNTDLNYQSQTICSNTAPIWYTNGSPAPVKIKLTYKDATSNLHSVYTTLRIGSYENILPLKYNYADKNQLKVTPITDFETIIPVRTATTTIAGYVRNNTVTSNKGMMGVINSVDKINKLININRLMKITLSSATSGYLAGDYIQKVGDNSYVARIYKVINSNSYLIENISDDNKSFYKTNLIIKYGSIGVSYTISDIKEEAIGSTDLLDNDSQFYGNKFTVEQNINVFKVGQSIKILNPLVDVTNTSLTSNDISFTVYPAFPCDDPNDATKCITLNSSTGLISGTFNNFLPSTKFTITAQNPISSQSIDVYISAINGPTNLALTNKQILTVTSTALFNEGDIIYTQITPPLTDSITGRVIKKLGNYKLAVEATAGSFSPEMSIDNGNSFLSEKAYIIADNTCTNKDYSSKTTCEAAGSGWSDGIINYNIAIVYPLTGKYFKGDIVVDFTTQAQGIVKYVYTNGGDTFFLTYITQNAASTSSALTFKDGDMLSIGGSFISTIFNENMRLKIASTTNYFVGGDVAATDTSALIGGIDATNKYLFVSDITGNTFDKTNGIVNDEVFTGSLAQRTSPAISPQALTEVTHDILFLTERGKNVELPASISSGNNLVYSIIPKLPTGLSLDPSTGKISGIATFASPRRDYTLYAENFVSKVQFVFSLEVRDYFQIKDDTKVPSFILHKVGDNQGPRKCRINANDILNPISGNKEPIDIRCFLDGEEEDFHFNGLKLKAQSGSGVCEYVQYLPYYFKNYSPLQSAGTSPHFPTVPTIQTGCTTIGTAPTADDCTSNYSTNIIPGPNCDEGFLTYNENVMIADNSGTCNTVASTISHTVKCGGKISACIAGPVRDLLSDDQITAGFRSLIYQSSNGFDQTWTISSPISHGDASNIRVANATVNNQCTMNNVDADKWATLNASETYWRHPLARANPFYSFYCLDSAQDIKARIRIAVREWDRSFTNLDPISGQSYKDIADKMNNFQADLFGRSYNNHNDWDNAYISTRGSNSACGTTNTGSCDVGGYTYKYDCERYGHTWTPSSGGYCEQTNKTTQSTCVAAGFNWMYDGLCINIAKTTSAACSGGNDIWHNNTDYSFPETNL